MRRFLFALFKTESGWTRWILAIILLTYFAFQNSEYFTPIKDYLSTEALTLKMGKASFTGFDLVNGLMTVMAVAWIASLIAVWVERSIGKLDKVNGNTRNLMLTGLKLIIFIIAAIVCLNVLGIDMTSLTLFSGAIGIGLGFGLQKITSNFISGLILLLEKSMEEGDLVELAVGEMGIVRKMGARYTLIETFDSKEIMIPNEDFITNRVINWTFTNKQGRVEIQVGVSYDSDLDKARTLIIEAAKSHERCSIDPEPKCYITQFADSSVNFLLYFWVDDVTEGRLDAKSDVYLSIWKSFKDNNITIPFPQSDVLIKNWKDTK